MLPMGVTRHAWRLPKNLRLSSRRCIRSCPRDPAAATVRSSGECRRCLATTPSASAPSTRRQRSRHYPSPAKLPVTLLERRLRLVRENLRATKSRPQRARELLATAQDRFAWLRDRLYAHWNPDAVPSAGAAAAPSSSAATTRARRVAIRMDARWWAWNVAFALLPAAAIGLYCEFHGKYVVHDYHTHKELESMRRLLGEDFVRQHAEELLPPPPDNLWTRIVRLGRDVQTWIASHQEGIITRDTQGSENDKGSPGMQSEEAKVRRSLPLRSEARDRTGEAASGSASSSTTPTSSSGASSDVPMSRLSSTEEASTQVLLERVQRLEERMNQQERGQPSSPVVTPAQQQQLEYQVERLNQSDIRNRMEDEKIIMWRKRIADKQKQRQAASVPERTGRGAAAADIDQEVRRDETGRRSHTTTTDPPSQSVWLQAKQLLWNRVPQPAISPQQDTTAPITGVPSVGDSGGHAVQGSKSSLAKAHSGGPVTGSSAARSDNENVSSNEPARKLWSFW